MKCEHDEAGLPQPARFWAILAISLNTVMVVIDTAIVVVALPTIARALAVSKSDAISLVAVTQFVALVALLPMAALGDRIGHRRLFRTGQLLFVAGSLLCLIAPSFPLLLAARAVQATGSAAVLSMAMALLRAIYPAASLGKGIGLNGVLIAIGAAMAPSLGGIVVVTLGWRWIFVSPLPLVIASFLLGGWLPKPRLQPSSFDWRGALYYAVSAGLMVATFSTVAYGDQLIVAASLMAVTLCAGTIFVRRELGIDRPVLPVDLLANPRFALGIGAALAAFAGSMAALLSLPFLLESILGQRPAVIGAVMMAWPLAMAVSAPVAGVLADRMPGGTLSAFGMALTCAGFVSLAMLPVDVGYAGLVSRIALCGLGIGFFTSPNSRLLIGATPGARTASAGGLISTTRILGQSSGAAIVALLMQPGQGRGEIAPTIAAGFALISCLFSLAHLFPAFADKGEQDLGMSQ